MTILFVNKFADTDILAIYEYLREKAGRKIAADYDLRFQTLFERLIQFPESGPKRPIFGEYIRIAVINPYVAVYRYDDDVDEIEILRILHGKRNISADDLPPSDAT